MSDSYRGARRIGTAGLTLTDGTFSGFINAHTAAQGITFGGGLMSRHNNPTDAVIGLTGYMFANIASGALIPVKCKHIRPATGFVIGLFD